MLVVGLGNPGMEYRGTRHNVGFAVVDCLLEQAGGCVWKPKYKGEYAEVVLAGCKLALLKPQTYMNHSGVSVAEARSLTKQQLADIFVVHDELDLPFAELRLKQGGGHGGHNGLRSLIEHLGGADFNRLRFGIGHPGKGADVTGYVLARFLPHEQKQLGRQIERAAQAIIKFASQGVEAARLWLAESKNSAK